jgi:hypothetical protein
MKIDSLFIPFIALACLLSCQEDISDSGSSGSGVIDPIVCSNDNSTSSNNIGCCRTPSSTNVFSETVTGDVRTINSNTYPNHEFCFAATIPTPTDHTFNLDATPTKATEPTPILSETNRPRRFFGVALNGVIFAPAPASPFIFEDTETGEFNWDWVFEPTNNQGSGPDLVGLDCSSAHSSAAGYHYHGNMFQYVEEVIGAGLSTTTTAPDSAIHIGWAADGFPILYRFGPDASGNLTLLKPGFKLKEGERPGDGITAPCGEYNGKYTLDYEFDSSAGDLDECNGIDREIRIYTVEGYKTFNYFYVITDDFPQIGRCASGTPNPSFDN